MALTLTTKAIEKLEDELERRHQRTQARRQKEAGFESLKLLADFDFAAVPTLDRKLVLEMATCQFILAKENWLICGPTGVGIVGDSLRQGSAPLSPRRRGRPRGLSTR